MFGVGVDGVFVANRADQQAEAASMAPFYQHEPGGDATP